MLLEKLDLPKIVEAKEDLIFPWFEEEGEEIKPPLLGIPHLWYTDEAFRFVFSLFSILIPLSASFSSKLYPIISFVRKFLFCATVQLTGVWASCVRQPSSQHAEGSSVQDPEPPTINQSPDGYEELFEDNEEVSGEQSQYDYGQVTQICNRVDEIEELFHAAFFPIVIPWMRINIRAENEYRELLFLRDWVEERFFWALEEQSSIVSISV
ncbi:hypothetical protein CYMTET_52767 [Cymbomonas tetramitiformis]|uniref:Uncharacterized protein n=1 Tax=Cymbomonas tetramitiformis TaxID=36881 RepID=A0AAE0BJP3_9CHLO|nr:hypothetical protein CYMTET_52767 [Cymbomonas tetramitiformis]